MTLVDALSSGIGKAMGALTGAFRGKRNGPSDPDEPRWPDEYVAFVNKEFQRRRQERTPWDLQWRLKIEFSNGNQFLDINPVSQALEEPPLLYDYEEREAFDQISPILEARISRLSRGRLIRKVRPASNQQRDIMSAKTSAKVIQAHEHDHDHQEMMSEIIPWMELIGTAFKKNGWNPGAGRLLGRMQDVNEDGTPGEPQDIYEGDIDPMVVSAFEIYPDNLHATWKQNRSIIHARAYPVKEIEDRWGVKVQEEACDAYTMQQTSIGLRGLGYGQGGYRLSVAKLKGHALVKEYWERPGRRYPNGRLIITAGTQLLYAGVLPYVVGKDGRPDLPFVPFYSIKKPSNFYGTCLVPRLIPVQRRYNALRNRKAEYLKRVAIGQLVVYVNSLENQDEIEYHGTTPGQIFYVYQGSNSPSYMEFPALPADFDREEATLLNEFRALSGVSDLAKMSDAPAGVKSGVALQLALEQDETRLSTPAGHIETAIVEDGKQILRLYRQFAQTPRIARVTNRSEVEVIDWVGSDITSDDVILEGGSGLAESPAARRQFIFDLLGSNLLNDPQTGTISREGRSKILEMIEFGHWESAADTDYDLQVSKARRQVAAIRSGFLPQVAPMDDALIHLQELNRWMLTSEFEELAEADLRVKVAAYQFQAELFMALQRQAAMQAALTQTAGPAPGAPHAPGGQQPGQPTQQQESPAAPAAV